MATCYAARLVCAATLFGFAAVPVWAQPTPDEQANTVHTRVYATAGRTWVNGNDGIQLSLGAETSPFSDKWALTVEGNATHMDFDALGTDNTLSLLGGLTFLRRGRDGWVATFARGLAGLSRSFGASGFAMLVGAGIDIPLRPKWGIRVMADVPIGFFDGGTDVGFRVTGGVVLPVGRNPR